MPAAPLGIPALGMNGMPWAADDRLMNELPTEEQQPWPPTRFNPIQFDLRVWDAWWTGDPDKLMRAYYSIGANSSIGRQYFATTGEAGISAVRPGQYRGGLIGSIRRFFWGQPTPPGEKRTNYHMPLAGDLASASAALLFAQPPSLKYEQDSAVQDALNDMVDDGMHAKFLESSEMCSALGGVYLRVVWDTDVADEAWIDLVPPDAAVPEFRYDRLVAVTFWSVVADEGKKVVRHLEKHIPHANVILHGLYEGDQQKIGRRIDLGAFQETRPIAQVATNGVIELPDQPRDASTVVYIPNMKPNKIWRDLGPSAAPLGRSDYSGLETDFDGLDEAWSSWMRDIRLGKARLIVPHSYLDNIGKGKGAVFEPEREVYAPLNMLVSGESAGPNAGIVQQQFNIRWQEHKGTVDAAIEYIITRAGFSGQTMGLIGDVAQTATEVVARERKSLTTRARKVNYWRPALGDILYGLMTVNQIVYNSRVEAVRPDIEFPDVVLPDALELAQTVAALRGAEAISIETAVATAHPDWDTDQVAEEVQRIYSEMNVDALSRARVMISGQPTESLEEQLESIPQALGTTDVTKQVEQVAGATADAGDGQQLE
jgi:A118 family predicted phage portal protein